MPIGDGAGWVLTDHELRHTDDDGATWRAVDLASFGRPAAWAFVDATTTVLASSVNGALVVTRTNDGGASMQATTVHAAPGETQPSLSFIDRARGYLALSSVPEGDIRTATVRSSLYRTNDGGVTWSLIAATSPVTRVAFSTALVEVVAGRSTVRGQQVEADVAEIRGDVRTVEGVSEPGRDVGVGVVAGAGNRDADREEVPLEARGDLEVEAMVVAFPGVQVVAMGPVPGRDQCSVDEDRGSVRAEVGDVAGDRVADRVAEQVPTPRHGGLRHPEDVGRSVLGEVLAHQRNHHRDRPVQPHRYQGSRIDLTGSELAGDAGDKAFELRTRQTTHILEPQRAPPVCQFFPAS